MQVVAHNILSQYTNRQLNISSDGKSKSAEKLSSGYKINRSADDAAGLQISEKMRWQIRGLNKASMNCEEAVSFCKVADGAMNEMHDMVARMKELSVQAANDTNTDRDRAAIQCEIDQICSEMQRISDDTEYNTLKVFSNERKKTVTSGTSGTSGASGTSEEIYSIVGNNYGLAEVIGKDHLSSVNKLNESMNYSGSGWHTTGKSGFRYNGNDETAASMDTILKNINPNLSSDFSTLKASPIGTWNGNDFTYDDGNGHEVFLSFYNNSIDHGYIRTYTENSYGNKTYNNTKYISSYAGNVGGEAVTGNSYGSIWLDFSGAGTDYKISDLYGEGFNTTCATCSKYYSIMFTDNGSQTTSSGGVRYNYVGNSLYPRLEVDISDCTNGGDIVQHIMDAVGSCTEFENHYTQYAYNDSEKGKIHVYDNRPWMTSGGSSTFEPTYRREDGTLKLNGEKNVTNPTSGDISTYTDKDMWIQSGAREDEGIWLHKPRINNSVLGINSINVLTFDDAQNAIALCDTATAIISSERSKMGAFQNRFEHAISVDDNTSENTQSAESLIRDTDMAAEMVNFSKHSILEQAGQAMLSQANQIPEGILKLLQ